MAIVKRSTPLLALVVPLLLIALIASGGSEVFQRQVTTMLMNLVLVVGLFVFAGNSGVLSFGHISFMAIGAYATAILTIPATQKAFLLPGLPEFLKDVELGAVPAALASGGVAMIVAAVLGVALMRLAGVAAALSLFAVLVIVHTVALHWDAVTRGNLTMIGVPTGTTMERALIFALVAIVVAHLFTQSRVGLRLRASREDEVAARSVGVRVARDRWLALVLSAFIVGAGGFLWAQFLGSFNPDAFYIDVTFLTIAMLVIGGVNSLAGAVVGTVAVSTLSELLLRVETDGLDVGPISVAGRGGVREVGLAIAMILILILRPSGITGGREFRWPSRLRVRRPTERDGDAVHVPVPGGGELSR